MRWGVFALNEEFQATETIYHRTEAEQAGPLESMESGCQSEHSTPLPHDYAKVWDP